MPMKLIAHPVISYKREIVGYESIDITDTATEVLTVSERDITMPYDIITLKELNIE